MTDFEILEDKYQVPLNLIIWKIKKKIERKEGNWFMSVIDEALHTETGKRRDKYLRTSPLLVAPK